MGTRMWCCGLLSHTSHTDRKHQAVHQRVKPAGCWGAADPQVRPNPTFCVWKSVVTTTTTSALFGKIMCHYLVLCGPCIVKQLLKSFLIMLFSHLINSTSKTLAQTCMLWDSWGQLAKKLPKSTLPWRPLSRQSVSHVLPYWISYIKTAAPI